VPQGNQVRPFVRIASHLRTIPAPHVPLKLVDRCRLRPADHIERNGLVCIATQTPHFKIEVAPVQRVTQCRRWLRGPTEAEREAAGTRWEGKPIQKAAQAAREVAKEWAAAEAIARSATRHHLSAEESDGIDKTPTAKRIQNLATERIPFPAEWTAQDYLFEAKSAARAAARRITEV
jgi:hypothetical protein